MSRPFTLLALMATILNLTPVRSLDAQESGSAPEAHSPLDHPLTLDLRGDAATVGAVLDALPPTLSLIYDSRVRALTGFEIRVTDLPAWQVLEALALVIPELTAHTSGEALVVLGYEARELAFGGGEPPFVPDPSLLAPPADVIFDAERDAPSSTLPDGTDPLDTSWLDDHQPTSLGDYYFTSALSAFDRGELQVAAMLLRQALKAEPDREFKLEPRYQKLLDRAEGR